MGAAGRLPAGSGVQRRLAGTGGARLEIPHAAEQGVTGAEVAEQGVTGAEAAATDAAEAGLWKTAAELLSSLCGTERAKRRSNSEMNTEVLRSEIANV